MSNCLGMSNRLGKHLLLNLFNSRQRVKWKGVIITLWAVGLWALSAGTAQAKGLHLGEATAFSYASLVEQARVRAGEAYAPPPVPQADILQKIDYDAHGKLHFKREYSPFADGSGEYPVTFFHLGKLFKKPVHMYLVEGGKAREVQYSPDYFTMPADSVARQLANDIGFAGFRFHESRQRDDWKTQDWVAFLGASYFRAIGSDGQYGLSARGVAIDTALPTPEEFPDFVAFYIEPAENTDESATVYAMLDGPSITGAYRFDLKRGENVVMDVEQTLFLRQPVQRLGIAPLTSMFWFSELNKSFRVDWRPEVHDSDGLVLWTGAGERIWRQLNNPATVRVSAFGDNNPKGFGLMQRDREVTHYLDGVRYHRRPSLWVEPIGAWGKGNVQLVELPTDDEIHDNIALFWTPAQLPAIGEPIHYRYRLHWQAAHPYPVKNLAQATATRLGRGGEAGKPRPEGVVKISVEWEGDVLGTLKYGEFPEIVVSASRGDISLIRAEPIMDTRIWRAVFDLKVEGEEPVELRMFLRRGDEPLSETWTYQYLPAIM